MFGGMGMGGTEDMDLQRQLAKHLAKLNKAIRRTVAKSSEFAQLRKLLRTEQVELAIYVVPVLKGKGKQYELAFQLTDEDRKFLKQAGITF